MSRFTVMVDGAYYAKNADGTIISGDLIDVLGVYEDITNALDGTERITLSELQGLVDAKVDGRCVVLPAPAKEGDPKPACFEDCSGSLWCLVQQISNTDDEPTERCKQCWYCDGGYFAEDYEECDAELDVRHAES